jgi:hypothetical protein
MEKILSIDKNGCAHDLGQKNTRPGVELKVVPSGRGESQSILYTHKRNRQQEKDGLGALKDAVRDE